MCFFFSPSYRTFRVCDGTPKSHRRLKRVNWSLNGKEQKSSEFQRVKGVVLRGKLEEKYGKSSMKHGL